MTVLLHGTTRSRAERIEAYGPDPNFVEPGSSVKAGGFSTCVAGGPFPLGTPQTYALGKSNQFRHEGGAAILEVDVPDEIIGQAVSDYFPLSQGVVQFDPGAGLEQLRLAWPTLRKQVRLVQPS